LDSSHQQLNATAESRFCLALYVRSPCGCFGTLPGRDCWVRVFAVQLIHSVRFGRAGGVNGVGHPTRHLGA